MCSHDTLVCLVALLGMLASYGVSVTIPANLPHRNGWVMGHQQDSEHRIQLPAMQADPLVGSASLGARLENQASQELMATFGEEFCDQVEEEDKIVRSVFEAKAKAGKEAGCAPGSPLSSPPQTPSAPWPCREESS